MKYDREYQQKWRRANPGWRHKLYGDKWSALLREHNATHTPSDKPRTSGITGDCGLCGRFNTLHVDHDHACCDSPQSCGDCVRGLVCSRCNYHVAWVENNVDAMAEYLGWK